MVEHGIFDIKTVLEMKNKGEVVNFLFITPSTAIDIEAFCLIYANDDFTCELFEGTITSNDGVPSDSMAFNVNRINNGVHSMHIFTTPSIVSVGNKLWVTRTWPSREPSGVKDNYSILPKPDTKYLWRITKNGTGTHFIDIDFWWREVYGIVT